MFATDTLTAMETADAKKYAHPVAVRLECQSKVVHNLNAEQVPVTRMLLNARHTNVREIAREFSSTEWETKYASPKTTWNKTSIRPPTATVKTISTATILIIAHKEHACPTVGATNFWIASILQTILELQRNVPGTSPAGRTAFVIVFVVRRALRVWNVPTARPNFVI